MKNITINVTIENVTLEKVKELPWSVDKYEAGHKTRNLSKNQIIMISRRMKDTPLSLNPTR